MFYINEQNDAVKKTLVWKYKRYLEDPKTRQQTIERLKHVRTRNKIFREKHFKQTELEEIAMARLMETKKEIEENVAQGTIDNQEGSKQIQELDRRIKDAKERYHTAWYKFDNDNAYIKGTSELIEEYTAK